MTDTTTLAPHIRAVPAWVAVLFTLTATGCVSNSATEPGSDGGLPEMTVMEDIAGEELHPVTLAAPNDLPRSRAGLNRHGPADLPELRAYVRSVLGKLLASSPMIGTEPREIDVFITTNPSNFTAAATPAVDILLGIEMFRPAPEYGVKGKTFRLRDEDGLAFLLAHELAHNARGHFAEDDGLRSQLRLTALVRQFAFIAERLATETDLIDDDREVRRTALKLRLAVEGLDLASQGILRPSWQRPQESEADRLAVDLMRRAGYLPNGAVEVAEAFQQQHARQQEVVREKYREIFDLFAKLQQADADSEMEGWLMSVGIGGAGKWTVDLMNVFADEYDDADEREADIKAYAKIYSKPEYERRYGRVEGVPDEESLRAGIPPRVEQLASTYLDPAVQAEALLEEAKGEEIEQLLGLIETKTEPSAERRAQLLAKAERYGKAAIGGWDGDQAYPRLVMHDIRHAQGQARNANLNLVYAIRDGAFAIELYDLLARSQASSGDRDGAMNVLANLKSRLPGSDYYDLEAEVMDVAGDEIAATGKINTCIARAESYSVQQRCSVKRMEMKDRKPGCGHGRGNGRGQSGRGSDAEPGFFDTLGQDLSELTN